MVAGPAIIAFALLLVTILAAGRTVYGTIGRMVEQPGSEGGTEYILHYDYTVNGRQFHASGSTGRKTFEHLKQGDTVTIKVLPQFPKLAPQLIDGNSHGSILAFTLGFGLLWSLLMMIPCYEAFVGPDRRTKVMANGKMVTGRIVNKSATGEDKNHFVLIFQYEPTPGKPRTDRRVVSEGQFERAQIGESVTILYDEAYPSESLIYRYSDYELIA